MIKDFAGWHEVKTRLHIREDAPTFQQREIWWCSVGMNIGHETDGKSQLYTRPVLVIRKFNRHIFLGVPLTSQIKDNPYYHRIYFRDKEQCAMLSQLRLWESKRLIDKMGKLSFGMFDEIRKALHSMI